MKVANFLADCRSHGKPLVGYGIDDLGVHFNVFHDRTGGNSMGSMWPCVTKVVEISGQGSGGRPSHHNVVLAYYVDPASGEEQLEIWCGDAFAEGRVPKKAERMRSGLDAAKTWFPNADHARLQREMDDGYGIGRLPSTGCNFWTQRSRGNCCKHVAHVMLSVDQSLVGDLAQAWKLVMEPGAAALASLDDVQLVRADLAAAAFVAPVLLVGPPSAGKTHLARSMAEGSAVAYVEYGCHDGTESLDLLGHTAPFGDGWVWRDGPVSEAFRRAMRGEKVVLCLDELLRVKPRHLTPLLTALSEYEGTFRLRTGRVLSAADGVGTEETLIAPVDRIAIVATTNIGTAYDIDALDPAIRKRFRLIFVDAQENVVKDALVAVLANRGWSGDDALSRLLDVFRRTALAARSGLLSDAMDVRALRRCVMTAPDAAGLKTALWAERLQCVGLDGEGRPIAEEAHHLRQLLDRVMQ